jgi:hypothetical protein
MSGANAMSPKAKGYIAGTVLVGLALLLLGIYQWQSSGTPRLLAFLTLAVLSSTFKMRLPRMKGTMSLSFLFILVGIMDLSLSETLLLACVSALVQTLWKPKSKPKFERITFNTATLVLSAGFGKATTHAVLSLAHTHSLIVLLGLAAFAFLLSNTALVAAVISLAEEKSFGKQWSHCFYWSFPFFLVGTTGAGLISAIGRSENWAVASLVLPLMYLTQLWYRTHIATLGRERVLVSPTHAHPGNHAGAPESPVASAISNR